MFKGYDVTKDTLLVKPYEYYKKSKGFTPHIKECQLTDSMNIGIAIRGFENNHIIPLSVLDNSIQFVLTDFSVNIIESGTLTHVGQSGGAFYHLQTDDLKNFRFAFSKKGMKRKAGQSLILFCIKVKRGNESFTIPAKQYILE